MAARFSAAGEHKLILLSAAEATAITKVLGITKSPAAESLRALADKALEAGPWSVTNHRPEGMDIAPNDYYSEGPYWWPDPNNPSGPYIRRDGETNPGRFTGNRRDLGDMCTAVLTLGMAACFLRESRYAAHASEILHKWFLNEKTRMNPHLEYGQAVRGRNTGRGAGIIDTVSLIHAVQGVTLLEHAGNLDATLASGLRRWFTDYLRWMTTSKKGLDEKKSGNNHATWWSAQAAAYATFVDDSSARNMVWEHCRTYLAPSEIRPDGSCPREEARTRSLSYSAFNLDAFSVLCRIAEKNGVDLWHSGVEKAFRYLQPYVLHPDTWHKQQITHFDQDRIVFLALAGLGLHSDEFLRDHRSLPRANAPWVLLIDLIVQSA